MVDSPHARLPYVRLMFPLFLNFIPFLFVPFSSNVGPPIAILMETGTVAVNVTWHQVKYEQADLKAEDS